MDLGLATLTAAVLVLAAALAWAVAASVTGRRRLERDLIATRAELEVLTHRLDELARTPASPPAGSGQRADYVITSLPDHAGSTSRRDAHVIGQPSRSEFASMALTESMVTVVAFAHGVRRALSPEARNRIRFEMGREVKRARRQRRREDKLARRHRTSDLDGAGLDPSRPVTRQRTHQAEDAA